MVEQVEIVKQLKTKEATILLRTDGIVEVTYNEGITIDVALQEVLLKEFWKICGDKKRCFLFSAFDYVTVTNEARKNAITIEDTTPVKATAIVTDSVAYKLIAKFYIKVNKPKSPLNIFSNKDEAIAWLKQFQ